jgi:hypothetical protein
LFYWKPYEYCQFLAGLILEEGEDVSLLVHLLLLALEEGMVL